MTWQRVILAASLAAITALIIAYWPRRDWRLRPHHRVIYRDHKWWLWIGDEQDTQAVILDRVRRLRVEEEL